MQVLIFWGPALNSWSAMGKMAGVTETRDVAFLLSEEAAFSEFVFDIYKDHSRRKIGAKIETLLGHPLFIRFALCEQADKEAIRASVDIKRDLFVTCHGSDTQEEAEYLWALSHPNNLHHARMRREMRDEFRSWIGRARKQLKGDGCVVGSGVLEACGIRTATDLDLIALDRQQRFSGSIDLASEGYSRGGLTDDRIITDPRLHFWCGGLKFANLNIVAARKARSSRSKDILDADLIARANGIR